MSSLNERTAFRINPDRKYRLGFDGPVLRPKDDPGIFNFSPGEVVFDNIRSYHMAKRLVDSGIVSAIAPIARGVAEISSEDEFVECLRTMVYDVEAGVTLEETLGGRDRFNSVVSQAKQILWEREHPYTQDPTFYDPT